MLPLLFSLLLYPAARCQDGGSETATLRGNRAELAITVRDISGQPIAAPAMVRLYRSGAPADQAATSKGRVFFVLPSLGDYMLIVDAPGYKTQPITTVNPRSHRLFAICCFMEPILAFQIH